MKGYQLHQHKYDDLVFVINEPGNFSDEPQHSSLESLLHWFMFIFVASLNAYAFRQIATRLERHATRNRGDDDAINNFLYSFVDSVAVFMGRAIHKFGYSRAERWFLIAFAIFGLILRTLYTGHSFCMCTTPAQDQHQERFSSIDQLLEANLRITVDYSAVDELYVQTKT